MNPLNPFTATIETTYEDPDNALSLNTRLLLANPTHFPPVTVSFSRKLFPSFPQRGSITLRASRNPSISFEYSSPPTLTITEGESLPQQGPPTTSGLRYVLFDKTVGITFQQAVPVLLAEMGLSLVELSMRLKCSIHLGLAGLMLTLGANWHNETTEVTPALTFSSNAMILHLE